MNFPLNPKNGDYYMADTHILYQYVAADNKWIIVPAIISYPGVTGQGA